MAATRPPIPWDRPSMSFEWVDWYTKLRNIIDESALDHNALLNLQGGVATQYYHLTAAQHTGLIGGNNTTLHFHDADRNRANHTGTQAWSTIASTPTTLGGYGITDGQSTSQKNAANGYAGLNASSRTTKGVDTTDDLVVDSATKGLVLKDTQGTPHYWRITIDNTGSLVITDLGTTKP